MTATIVGNFLIVYLGMILGRLPFFQLDRTGVALRGAIALISIDAVSLEAAAGSVHLPTVILLFSFMVVSAQMRLGGFYDWATHRFASWSYSPSGLLAALMAGVAVLLAVFSNDFVRLAVAPALIEACRRRQLDPGLICLDRLARPILAPSVLQSREDVMAQLVLVRHGESQWNLEGRFTGWTDIDLTRVGIEQMQRAGGALSEAGLRFDLAITSRLKRAIRSQWLLLEALDAMWIPSIADWRMNERHYGALTGMLKTDAERCFGAANVRAWRRGFGSRPPAMPRDDPRALQGDPRYTTVPATSLPLAESLSDTMVRVQLFWQDSIAPALLAGRRILISAHGNSLRALIKLLEQVSDEDITHLDVPNGIPLVYRPDAALGVIERHYLELPHPARSTIL